MFKNLPDLKEYPSADIILYKLMESAVEDSFINPENLPTYILKKLNAIEYSDNIELPSESKWFKDTFLEVIDSNDNANQASALSYYMTGILSFIYKYRIKDRIQEWDSLKHTYGIYNINKKAYILYEKTEPL